MVPTCVEPYRDGELRIGWASWDKSRFKDRSIKYAYPDKSGKISRGCPELPFDILVDMVVRAYALGELNPEQIAQIRIAFAKKPAAPVMQVTSKSIIPTEKVAPVRTTTGIPLENLAHLSIEALYNIAINNSHLFEQTIGIPLSIDQTSSVEFVGHQMNSLKLKYIDTSWERLKHEFHLLICTNDKKYRTLRKKINASEHNSEIAVVGMISAAVAAQVGPLAGALIPFCAICLTAVVKLGKEAFCREERLDIRVGPE
jgi:hypothetical protein